MQPGKKPTRDMLDALFSLAYEELRRLASRVRRDNPSATLNPTALVNEAWIKLANSGDFAPMSIEHFKGVAARAMRQVLVDAARRRYSSKRGGDDVQVVVLNEALDGIASYDDELLAIHEALEELERAEPRQAKVVEYRYFGGYSASEIAELLGISEVTVNRDWRVARAWLSVRARSLAGASS
jgi:RNA polymerase sigma factor (TIGR02999 family)